jgi:hypothetical protein
LGEGPRDHEVFHHVTVLELVLDGACVIGVDFLEQSLEVVCQRSRVVLDAAFGGRDALNVGVVRPFVDVIVVVTRCDSGPVRAPPLPPLIALDILHGALDDDAG